MADERTVRSAGQPFNAATFFVDRHVSEGRGTSLACSSGERALCYRELQELVNRFGNGLLGLGIARGDRVMLLLLDGPEFVASFFGAVKIGAVPVPVNTSLKSPDYAYLLADSRARVLVVSASLHDPVSAALGGAAHLEHTIVAGGRAPGALEFDRFVEAAGSALTATGTAWDDPAFWLYSSGSTGVPKGAVHRQRDMVVSAEGYGGGVLELSASDRCFSAAKLFFAYGLGNNMYLPMHAGAASVLYPDRPLPESVFATIDRYRPTIFFGVPTLYRGMLAVPDAPGRFDLSSLRLCVSAGEALPASIYQRWFDRFGLEILDGIGSTEILHIFLSNRPGQVRPGSSGRPVPGYDACIVDESGQPVPDGTTGNLRIRGESVMLGYWNQPERTRRTLVGDWIETGDRYSRDADGYYWYRGREDDMLKVCGIWVAPPEVEESLCAHPAVLEAAVVGKQDADGLVKPRAFVVLRDPAAAGPELAAELQRLVTERLAPYKCPRWIEFLDQLPKTATGKLQRFRLRQA